MDKKQVIVWAVWAIGRGLAWVLAAKFGMDATEAQGQGAAAANALGAVALVVLSLVSSIKGRKAILATEPPAKASDPLDALDELAR